VVAWVFATSRIFDRISITERTNLALETIGTF